MNIVFGQVHLAEGFDSDGLRSCSDVSEFIAAEHGKPAHRVGGSATAELWLASDEGVIAGQAERDGVSVALLATLHGPQVDPLAEQTGATTPEQAAEYFLDRYLRLDSKFTQDVVGQYAVVVADARTNRVLLACDALGHRTIYYYQQDGCLAFSTNLKTLTHHLGARLQLDRSREDFLLLYGFYPQGATAYQGVKALDKAGVLDWTQGQSIVEQAAFTNPWQSRFSTEQLQGASQQEVVNALYDGFMEALQDQLPPDETVGVLLGGFDSALVAAALQRLGKKVETFSFDYDAQQYNQPHTDTLQAHLGHTHHRIPLTEAMLRDGLKNFAKYFNQPTNWPNYVIQTADACQHIRARNIRYCYTGDGCDSVFMGYPGTYRRARAFEALPVLPTAASRLLAKVAAQPMLDRRLGHPYRVALSMIRALGRPMPARGYLSFRVMDEVSLKLLRNGDTPAQQPATEQLVQQLAAPHEGLSGLRLAYLGKSAVSPNRNKMVGSSDRTGLALLSPYMHPGMKALSLSLPDSLCRPQESTPSKITGKYILMKMAEDKALLPKEVIYQPKVAAVDGPIDEWYATSLRSTILSLLEGLPFPYSKQYANQLLNEKHAERLFKRYVMTDKVISHAPSLAVTYASFAKLAARPAPERTAPNPR